MTETTDGILVTGVTPLHRRAGIVGVGAMNLHLSHEQIDQADREIAGSHRWFRRA
ncbi:MAG: hypothetical protein ACR2JY_12745 [Chloroflexota bacterium]